MEESQKTVNPTIRTIRKVERYVEKCKHEVFSCASVEKALGLNHNPARFVVEQMLQEGKIRIVNSPSRGTLYARCNNQT